MSERYTPNPEVTRLARKVIATLERELAGSLLSAQDQAALLLAAAHGRAGMPREQLERYARAVWDGCDEGKRRESRSVDFDVGKVDQKIFGGR